MPATTMASAMGPRRTMVFRSMVIIRSSSATGSRKRTIQSYALEAGGVMPSVVETVGRKYA
ncbi:MAG: hypothetical protein P8099_01805 [Gemmatimonadota bacterium]